MYKRIKAADVKLKRAYEGSAAQDGTRIWIDRLWPSGVKKADAVIDQWAKDIAPSTELRKWFGHDPARRRELRNRYAAEIREHRDSIGKLRALARQGSVTLVYAAHDESQNDAVPLTGFLLGRRAKQKAKAVSAAA
jgi:uncharacterized protein YeaO (DUF488 family)